ncbi:MBL fold metallo-hydrolase [Streptomyces sp. NPDC042638]|uniref:MBL fold metallo-hydrolase n=1 Tax=Streptomyces sp. NPDC042638 TaxID=3154333 RepID=UPI0033C02992
MKITFLGHAGALVEADGVKLVCDPWFSEGGAFLSGWHQLPDNRSCAPLVGEATHVYVSHDHQDHFDPDVLNALDPSVTLLMPDYPLPTWKRLIRTLRGPAPVLLGDQEVFRAGPLRLTLIHSPTPRHQDSALVIEDAATGQVVVNLNDCQVDRDQLRAIRRSHPRIDVVLAQFSGATWFPFAYSFPAVEQVEAAGRKKVNSMRRWTRYMQALAPRSAVAFAGPPALLDPGLAPHFFAESSVFTTPPELLAWLRREHPDLAERTVAPLPGDELDVATGRLFADPGIREEFDWENLADYVADYARRRASAIAEVVAGHPEPRHSLYDGFAAHFKALFAAGESLCRAVDAVAAFDVRGPGGGFWLVDFRSLEVREGTGPETDAHDYRFTLPSRYLPDILDGGMSWEEFFFSFRFSAWRPGIGAYNEELMSVLRCSDPDDLAEYLRRTAQGSERPAGTFPLRTRTGSYRVSDTCPHLGARLGPQDYDPELDSVVCPQHGWRFALPDGACSNGRARLGVSPAGPAADPDPDPDSDSDSDTLTDAPRRPRERQEDK